MKYNLTTRVRGSNKFWKDECAKMVGGQCTWGAFKALYHFQHTFPCTTLLTGCFWVEPKI